MVVSLWIAAVSPALAEGGVGDVYVNAEAGGYIVVDGKATGLVTPGIVRGVSAGPHTVRVDLGCRSGGADVNVRVNAIERVELALAPAWGTYAVYAQPYGAEVHEGETLVGVAPLGPINAPCGTHVLTLTSAGYATATYTAEVPARGHVDVRVQLLKVSVGGVAVVVSPLEAEVLVDGLPRGTGPMTLDGLPAGVHHIEARAEGYLPLVQDITVDPDQISRAAFALVPKPPPEPLAKKLGLDRVPWGRVAVDVAVTGAAAGLGWLAYDRYGAAVDAYATYSTMTYDQSPDAFYADNVAAPRTLSYVSGVGAGLSLATAGVLWATTKVEPRAERVPVMEPVQTAPAVTTPTPTR